MKFIHCSDLHLGAPHTSLPSEKASVRGQEILYTFDRLCEYATQHEVTAIILAGDVFDVRKITKKIKERFLNAIKKCPNIDFLYLSGNHDDAIVFADQTQVPSNLKLFGNDWTSFRYGNVNVQGVILDKLNSKGVFSSFIAQKEDVNVVVMHGQIAGYKTDGEGETISLPAIKNKCVDYLALGHYHSYSVGNIDDRGIYAYSGCLEGRGFDETGDKGFILLDIDGNKINHTFIKFASRDLFEIEFAIDSSADWFTNRENLISRLNNLSEKSLVKVVLIGSHPIDYTIDKDEISHKLNQKFFFAKVYDKTSILVDENSYLNDPSIKGEFIRLVASSDLDEQLKSKVILCGLNALSGEELL